MKVGIDADSMIGSLLYRSVERCGSLRFGEAEFDEAFRELDADLHRSELYFIFVTPLFGLKAESLPLGFAPTIEIDHLTDLEIVHCLRNGLWPASMHAVRAGIADVGSGIGVRIRVAASTEFGETSEGESNGVIQLEQMREQAECVTDALRLFKEGQISVPGHVMFSEQWPSDFSLKIPNPGSTLIACDYELKADEAVEFQRFWSDLQKCAEKPVDAAIRRFRYAGERHRPEDQLVDVMIAAESLFLADTNLEVSYRLSVRFALFIEGSDYSRRELFNHMKKAYHVRSIIVHGKEPKRRDLALPKRGQVTFPEFVHETRELLRLSLKKAIRMAAANDPAFGHWEKPILD